jgi:choloylglycine hydrolase
MKAMISPRLSRRAGPLAFVSGLALAAPAFACSSLQLSAADGSSVVARSMDFEGDLDDRVTLYPRGQKVQSKAPDGGAGLSFTSKYAAFGVFPLGVKIAAADAMNEKGLTVALQWLQASGFPTSIPAGRADKALAAEDLIVWLMGQFATVDEVKAGLADVAVWAAPIPQLGNQLPPLHLIMFDASGKGLVIEFIDGKVRAHDNPVGVATNDPTFDWQLTNLQSYIALSDVNAEPTRFGALKVAPHGSGFGQLGMPGDATPPSRFVRLAFNRTYADVPADAPAALAAISHIIAGVVVPAGSVRTSAKPGGPQDITIYTTLRDQKNGAYYIRPAKSMNFYKIDLTKLWDRQSIPALSIVDLAKAGQEDVTDLLLK